MNSLKNLLALLLFFGTLTSMMAQVSAVNTTIGTNSSSAIGQNTTANGLRSLAAGFYSNAPGHYSFALGTRTLAQHYHSMVFGMDIESTARMAVTIGEGAHPTPLTNAIPSSLMVGFNSDIPTLFVGKSNGVGTIGKVGIGTTLPNGLLEISDDTNPNLLLSGLSTSLELGVATTAGSFSSLAQVGDVVLKGTNNRRMIFTTNSGQASPAKEFIFANTNGALTRLSDAGLWKLYDGSGTNDYMEFDVKWDGNYYWNFNSPSPGSVQRLHIGYVSGFASNNQPDRILDAIVVGTADAANLGYTTKLIVHGEVQSCGVKTQEVTVEDLGWCDYVFAKDYPLMPLKEVASFIAKNQHLPNIPSAQEVADNGRELGDMQKRMMEKIEELTLYVIQLEQEIDSLKEDK